MIKIAKTIIICLAASPLMANMIWPGLYLYHYLFSLYSIIPALIVEWIAIKYIFNFSLQRAFVIATIVNVVSAAVGYIVYGPASFLYQVGLESLKLTGTFNYASWFANYVFAIFFTTILEYYAIRFIFKIKFPLKSRPFFYFLFANVVSVSLSFAMMYYEHKEEQEKSAPRQESRSQKTS
jgi:hypothetical protein